MQKRMRFRNPEKKAAHQSEYLSIIEDLLDNESVQKMDEFRHHYRTTCLAHSLNVSYYSYRICKFWKLDYRSAARGALLHDMFLYDRRTTDLEGVPHTLAHPAIALQNAADVSDLNDIEEDIVIKHMWPLTPQLPKYGESMVVCLMDKYCSTLELGFGQRRPLPSAGMAYLGYTQIS